MKNSDKSKETTFSFIIGLMVAMVFWFMFSEGVNDARDNENVKTEKIKSE